jgi:quercetin dioxygenase-like cupin family protein
MSDTVDQSSTQRGYVLHADEGLNPGDSSTKASRGSTGGVFTLIETHTTGGAPPHIHSLDDEFFYVVDGSIIVWCGDEVWEAGARSFVYLPRGVPHAWDVTSAEPAIVLMMTAPAGLEAFLGEYHAATSTEARSEIAARYGITWLPNDYFTARK